MDTNGSPTSPAPNPPSPIPQREESAEETRLNSMIREFGHMDPDPPTDLFATERDHLSQASLGLTEALHRLQQLRTSIASLTDRYPNAHARAVGDGDGVGPSHAAIVLSDRNNENPRNGTADDPIPVRVRGNISATAMERLEEFETLRAARASPMRRSVRTPSSPALAPPRRGHRSPPLPDLLVPTRRSWLETPVARPRDTSPDDGSTALGRRVAARAAAGGTSADARRAGLSEGDRLFLNRTTEFANGLERAVQDLRGGTAAGSQWHLLRSARAVRDEDGPPPLLPEGSRYPDPIGTIPDRMRASTRPPSWTGPASSADELEQRRQDGYTRSTPNASGSAASGAQNRNYLVRRRLNADGEEHVHTIDLETWEQDEAMDWLMPSVPPTARQNPDLPTPAEHRTRLTRLQRELYRTANEPVASSEDRSRQFVPPAPASRRSRGWARLDADGVEIDSEEEGNQERARAREYLRARRFNSSELVEIERRAPVRRETLVPMTRTSMSHALPEVAAPARVRINPPPPPWAEWSPSPWVNALYDDPPAIRPFVAPPNRPQNVPIRTPSPLNELYHAFIADPLPMPLTAMIPEIALPRKSHNNKIRVHDPIAGR